MRNLSLLRQSVSTLQRRKRETEEIRDRLKGEELTVKTEIRIQSWYFIISQGTPFRKGSRKERGLKGSLTLMEKEGGI